MDFLLYVRKFIERRKYFAEKITIILVHPPATGEIKYFSRTLKTIIN